MEINNAVHNELRFMNCFIKSFYNLTKLKVSVLLFDYLHLVCHKIESISGTKFDFGIAEIQKFPRRYIYYFISIQDKHFPRGNSAIKTIKFLINGVFLEELETFKS